MNVRPDLEGRSGQTSETAKEPTDSQVEATLWKVTITDELKLHRKHMLLLFKSVSLIHAQI